MPVMLNWLTWVRILGSIYSVCTSHLKMSHQGTSFQNGMKVLQQSFFKSTQSTSKTKPKSKSSSLDGDFVSSTQTLDLQCSYLRRSWDIATFAHVETAGWFLWRPFGPVSFDWGLGPRMELELGAANINLPLRVVFSAVSQFSQQRYAADNPELNLGPRSPWWAVRERGARFHVSLINCLFFFFLAAFS